MSIIRKTWLLALCCLLCLAARGNENTYFSENGLRYRILSLTEGTAEVVGPSGQACQGELSIPGKAGYGYKVVSIGERAFAESPRLTAVSLPNTLKRIEGWAFHHCTALTSVSLPRGLCHIGDCAFQLCTSLTSVSLPRDLQHVGDYAFAACHSLSDVHLPGKVTHIGKGAFFLCQSLYYLALPAQVAHIGESAFGNCGYLHFEVDRRNPYYAAKAGVLYNKDTTALLAYAQDRMQPSFRIPEHVRSIGRWAFGDCKSLASVQFPAGLESIGEYAFTDCQALTAVHIPAHVVQIGKGAFSECTHLASLDIPEGAAALGEEAFAACQALADVRLAGVRSIGRHTFDRCPALTSILLYAHLGYIDPEAFGECGTLSIDVEKGHPLFSARDGVLYDKSGSTLLMYRKSQWKPAFQVPQGVKAIGERAFAGNRSLTSVSLPASVGLVGTEAFRGCDKLAAINLPAHVSTIEKGAFDQCPALHRLSIPARTRRIAPGAFSRCDQLELDVDPKNPSYASLDGVLYDKALTTLLAYTKGQTQPFFGLPASVRTIGDEAFAYSPVYSVTLPDTLHTIGARAFFGCTSLPSLLVPAHVRQIGDEAFAQCYNLVLETSAHNPALSTADGVLYTKDGSTLLAYAKDNIHPDFTLPANVTRVGISAFQGCLALKKLRLSAATPPAAHEDAFRSIAERTTLFVPAGSLDLYRTAPGWSTFTDIRETTTHPDQ